ncbi:hypothetical protein FXO37_14429 [Capsicum annuum]|nr:hypothetical protein FXO37_14429 [Capsicum annuum]
MLSFQISKKVVPAGTSHKDYEINSDDDFQDSPRPQKHSITKKYHNDSSTSPVKKNLKQQHKGLDEQSPKGTPQPRVSKKLSVRTSIFKSIKSKNKLASKRKDINRSASKTSISVQSPDPSLSSFEDKNIVVMKKVFEKFCDEICEELNFILELVSSRFDRLMIAITENKVTEEIKGNRSTSLMEVYNEDNDNVLDKLILICMKQEMYVIYREAHISDSQFSFSDELLRNNNLDFIKFNLGVEDESTNKECDAEQIVNPSKDNVDKSKLDP